MVSFMQLVCATGLTLVCFIVFTEQAAMPPSPLLDDDINFVKRRIEAHARTSIPLFRGSNLGIFVRKRPFSLLPEHSMVRRKDSQSAPANEEDLLTETLSNAENIQRRFDDYSENPGPMFGR